MKKIMLIFFYSAFMIPVFPQNKIVLTNRKEIGENYLENSKLYADEINFTENIYNLYFDSTGNRLTILFRKINNGKYTTLDGTMALFDQSEMKMCWNRKVNYLNNKFIQKDSVLIQSGINKSTRISLLNGTPVWTEKKEVYFIDAGEKVAVGYWIPNVTGSKEMMTGMDISSGKSLWSRFITGQYGWNSVINLNDSTILLEAAGLHEINLRNGFGWDYNSLTGKKDYTGTLIAGAAGIGLGLLTGFYFIPLGYNQINGIASNIITNNESIYFASREKLTKLNHDGEVKWTFTLPEKLMSRSFISIRNDSLFLLNLGFAFMGTTPVKYGEPFIGLYDTETGSQYFLESLNEKKEPLNDFIIRGDSLLLLFRNMLRIFSIKNHYIITEMKYDTDSLGNLIRFVNDKRYIESGSRIYSTLKMVNPAKNYIETTKKKILELNAVNEVSGVHIPEEFYTEETCYKSYRVLSGNTETIIINDRNVAVAKINTKGEFKRTGSFLFIINNATLSEIDLDQLTNNNKSD